MSKNILNQSLLAAYSGLWSLAQPVLRRHKRLCDNFDQRLVPDGWPADDDAGVAFPAGAEPLRIWIQAASGGEAWLAHSLIAALADAAASRPAFAGRPLKILCTTCTRQGLEVLERLAVPGPRIIARYCPLDKPGLMRKAVRQAAPHLVVLLETELWPGLLDAAREQHVPVVVVNARMTPKSHGAYSLTRSFWRELAPERVLAVSPDDAKRFGDLFGDAARIGLMPNMKFDRLAEHPPESMAAALRDSAGIPQDCLLAVLASVREEEEDMLLPAIRSLYGRDIEGVRIALAVAPRHMHRVDAWREKLAAAGIACLPRSGADSAGAAESGDRALPVLLWDTFGELASLYAVADAVFVGGTLAPLGGQNFLEPAARGVTPLVGPHTENFLWVDKGFFEQGLARRIDAGGLAEALELDLALRLRAMTPLREKEGLSWAEARQAGAEQVRELFARWLAPHLGGSKQAAENITEILLEFFSRSG